MLINAHLEKLLLRLLGPWVRDVVEEKYALKKGFNENELSK